MSQTSRPCRGHLRGMGVPILLRLQRGVLRAHFRAEDRTKDLLRERTLLPPLATRGCDALHHRGGDTRLRLRDSFCLGPLVRHGLAPHRAGFLSLCSPTIPLARGENKDSHPWQVGRSEGTADAWLTPRWRVVHQLGGEMQGDSPLLRDGVT